MKKTISALLSIVLIFTLTVPAFASGFENFYEVNNYHDGQFYDVPAGRWYTENVRSAYELGIMQGMSANSFSPEGTLTCIQTIVMACRIHSIYNGINYDFSSGTPYWYTPYLEYAGSHGIITVLDEYLNVPIDRESFAVILGTSLPDSALPAINTIEKGSIPDISLYEKCYPHIYRLYRAGILTGNDGYGTFAPMSNITRGAAAAIVSRMADPSLRKHFSLSKRTVEIVPLYQLQNLRSLRKNTTDAEIQAAYNVALEIVTPLADLPIPDQLMGIATELRKRFNPDNYTMTEAHYNDPYGYLVLGLASCAGCTRTTGLCLNMLGIPYEHVNENNYGHQWARVNISGEYWICDAFGLCCDPEPYPYGHPYF